MDLVVSSSSYTLHLHFFFLFLHMLSGKKLLQRSTQQKKQLPQPPRHTSWLENTRILFWMGFFFFSCLKREDKCLDNSQHNKGNNFPFIMYTDSFQIELILPPTAYFLWSEYNHNTLQHNKQLLSQEFNMQPCLQQDPMSSFGAESRQNVLLVFTVSSRCHIQWGRSVVAICCDFPCDANPQARFYCLKLFFFLPRPPHPVFMRRIKDN